jgi:hypothetical protein
MKKKNTFLTAENLEHSTTLLPYFIEYNAHTSIVRT